VQYELRTQVIEPRRRTFQYLVDRYGDRPASRYEEGTIDVQATEHFHYRPLWAPDHELYDESWSALRLTDPYSFTDPRQYYYAPYVTARAGLHDAFGKSLDYLVERDLFERLPEGWRALLADAVLPLRHYESGAQLISVAGARFAYGTTVEQCCSFAAFDRIGNAQLLSRVGLALDGGSDTLLATAKTAWMDEPALQGLRRLVEELLVEPDWATGVIGLDLADRMLYHLLYRHLDEAALLGGAGAYSLVAQHLATWFDDQRRWIDALLVAWLADPEHGAGNKAALEAIVAGRLGQAAEAVADLAAAIDARVDAGATKAAAVAHEQLRADLAGLGLTVTEVSR
jgi:phenol/toluene 2-monooxygenase (NADH) P1/A1